jgi:hypothetical protein
VTLVYWRRFVLRPASAELSVVDWLYGYKGIPKMNEIIRCSHSGSWPYASRSTEKKQLIVDSDLGGRRFCALTESCRTNGLIRIPIYMKRRVGKKGKKVAGCHERWAGGKGVEDEETGRESSEDEGKSARSVGIHLQHQLQQYRRLVSVGRYPVQ